MLVPINWLNDFVDTIEDVEQLSKRLTMSGSNVESVEHWGKGIENIVIGKLMKIKKHPNADKLLLVDVYTGNQNIRVVTGATNIEVEDKVPVALHGAIIASGDSIRASKFRGVKSEGMLCSAKELGLDDHGLPRSIREGILILPKDAPLGEDIANYLNLRDVVFDFEITPNRSDCLSIIGMAREVAATFKTRLHIPEIKLKEQAGHLARDKAKITIEAKDLCRRYVARIVEDVVIEPSPLWMQRRLQTCGVRPINNIVDITNYVMLEMGQPLHAFDYDKLMGHSIIVRRGKSSEKIKTLDGITRKVDENMLIIADDQKPVAIAGVMGGADSEITAATTCILLESANFHGPSVRRTSRRLGLRSEASSRFEKGIDPNICVKAADRACELMEQFGAGKVLKGCIDVFPGKTNPKKIPFNPKRINKVLGTDISPNEMEDMLKYLGISIKTTNNNQKAIIPTFRLDMAEEADIIEEVGRMYGYDKLPITLPQGNVTYGKLSIHQKHINTIKDVLVNNGYSEIYTYSFMSEKAFDKIKAPYDSSVRKAINLQNPLTEEYSIMRTTLLPKMLEVIRFNLNRDISELSLFEIGAVYLPKCLPLKELPYENKRIAIGLCRGSMDFYNLKKIIETLFMRLRIKDYDFMQKVHFSYHPVRCAQIMLSNDEIGFAGEIHPDVLDNHEINKKVYIAELDLDKILKLVFVPYPSFLLQIGIWQ